VEYRKEWAYLVKEFINNWEVKEYKSIPPVFQGIFHRLPCGRMKLGLPST
jgi:hypothetical protein